MEIDTGLEISTAWFGCACYGFRIGNRFGVEAIQKYLEMCNIGVFDDFSRMGFFGEEAWAGNGWRNSLKSQLFVLLVCIRDSASKADYRAQGKRCTMKTGSWVISISWIFEIATSFSVCWKAKNFWRRDWELRLPYWQQWSMPIFCFYLLENKLRKCRKVVFFPSKKDRSKVN